MKMNDATSMVEKGWIRKPKGFRVRFQKKIDDEIMTDYAPGIDEKPLESDVVAWRLAWKLAQVQEGGFEEFRDENLFNILVVDDLDNPVNHYGTGKPEIFVPEK